MVTISKWNALDYLGNEDAMTGYIQDALEEEGIEGFIDAAEDVMKARAILQLSRETGIDYKELCRTFSHDVKPSQQTIKKISKALVAPL